MLQLKRHQNQRKKNRHQCETGCDVLVETSIISGELICKYFHVMLTIGSSQTLSYRDLENEYLDNNNHLLPCNILSVQEAQGQQKYSNKNKCII